MEAVENVLVLADGYERDRQMDAARKKQDQKRPAGVAAASTNPASAAVASTSASTRPKSKPKSPPPKPQKQQQQLQQDAQPQQQQQEYQRASPAARGRGGRRGGRGVSNVLRRENERLHAQVMALTGSPASASTNSSETSVKTREDDAQRRLRELAER